MLIRTHAWNRLMEQLRPEEQRDVAGAITGQVICPAGVTVEIATLPDELQVKVREFLKK